jgi:hypothetical protein
MEGHWRKKKKTLNGTGVAPTSEARTAVILVLLVAGNSKL